jgi:hypothetical protein
MIRGFGLGELPAQILLAGLHLLQPLAQVAQLGPGARVRL